MKIELDVPDQLLYDQLCTARDSGIAYWVNEAKLVPPPEGKEITPFEGRKVGWADYALSESGSAILLRAEGHAPSKDSPDYPFWRLDRAAIQKGLPAMAAKGARHFADMMKQNGDATTSDVFVQCCLFGEIVFG